MLNWQTPLSDSSTRNSPLLGLSHIAEPTGEYDNPRTHGGVINGRRGGRADATGPSTEWATRHFLNSCAQQWQASAIDMKVDQRCFHSEDRLSTDERRLVVSALGLLGSIEDRLSNNPLLKLYPHISNLACRQYLLRQAYEEAQHAFSYRYAIQALCLPDDAIRSHFREIPAVLQIAKLTSNNSSRLHDPRFCTGDIGSDRTLVRELAACYLVNKGIFGQSGMVQILSPSLTHRLPGLARLFRHVHEDNERHLAFGMRLMKQIHQENPQLWSGQMEQSLRQMQNDALDAEICYAYETLPHGIDGLNANMLEQHLKIRSSIIRLRTSGKAEPAVERSPCHWMTIQCDSDKTAPQGKTTHDHQPPLNWD